MKEETRNLLLNLLIGVIMMITVIVAVILVLNYFIINCEGFPETINECVKNMTLVN